MKTKTLSMIVLLAALGGVVAVLSDKFDSEEPDIAGRTNISGEDAGAVEKPQAVGAVSRFSGSAPRGSSEEQTIDRDDALVGNGPESIAGSTESDGDYNGSDSTQQAISQDIVSLWDTDPTLKPAHEEVPSEYIRTDPSVLAALGMSSQVEVYIPQTGRSYNGKVVKVNSIVSGVAHLDVELDDVDNIYRMSINRGTQATYIWVATPEGVFNVEIDNKSGEGKVTNDADIAARWPLTDDMVVDNDGGKEIEPPPEI
ncbi:MAG: hypothetical protein KZQ76_09245 [Candidatus Thiodiazotropha sp. (ex Epidulcina cf. delphinae)]|nr:hypothetical protein [Candidatus Thiodiazotropha sp. (ex Epidulcina cf. delphinae)]